MKKHDLKLVDADAEQIHERFKTAFDRANVKGAKKADREKVRELLTDHADLKLWSRVPGVMGTAESFLLENSGLSDSVVLCWRENLNRVRKGLGFDDAPEVEQLLITHASLCWLRLGLLEIQHTQHISGAHTFAAGLYWDRRLSAAQRRFSRAAVQLSRVRKLSAEADRARRSATAASARTLRSLIG